MPASIHQSDSIGKLADALAKAQAIMKPAKKEAENPFYKSKYADLASVWEAIREPLTKHGLSIVQLPGESLDGDVSLVTILMHTSGEWVTSQFSMKPTKNDPQAIGSCLTYARRYALAAITGVAAEEDDDGQAASQPAQQKAVQAIPKAASDTLKVMHPVEPGFTWRINGKMKGKDLSEIESGYLDWYSKNGNVQDYRAAAIMELDRRAGQEIFAGQGQDADFDVNQDQY